MYDPDAVLGGLSLRHADVDSKEVRRKLAEM